MLKPVNLNGFVLQEEDLKEFMPNATQDDMEKVAEVLTDNLMEYWSSALEEAVVVIDNEKRDHGRV